MSRRNRKRPGPLPIAAPAPEPLEPDKRRIWIGALLCAALTIAGLAPFATRAFNIDDTLFLYAARQIGDHPADPYGFVINWYGHEMPMSDVTQNPPLACYFIALAAGCLGWSEAALHIAFMLPAVAVVLGTYFLALRFCGKPLVAALATAFCPVFMVSNVTVMCDTLMLAFWMWAVISWLRGMGGGNRVFPILSACLIAAAVLTKYFAIALVPLLLAYSLLRWQRIGWRILYLLIPIVAVLLYDSVTRSLYGRSMFLGAGSYAAARASPSEYADRLLITLSFMGGCLAMMLFYSPLLWSRWGVAIGVVAAGLLFGLFSSMTKISNFPFPADHGARLTLAAHFAVFVVAGAGVLALAIADLKHRRDAESALLLLWIVGTFLFSWVLNWTINGRSILPMAPVVSILIVRRVQQRWPDWAAWRFRWEFVPLVLTGLLAMAVTWADVKLADVARTAAAEIHNRYAGREDRVQFQGHWGFQYYMESLGFKAWIIGEQVPPGGVLILPENNTNVYQLPMPPFAEVDRIQLPACPIMTTMNIANGAGFYASVWGPLPFAFCAVPMECYHVMVLTSK